MDSFIKDSKDADYLVFPHLTLFQRMKLKGIEEASPQLAFIKNHLYTSKMWFNKAFGQEPKLHAMLENKYLKLKLLDENNEIRGIVIKASDLLKLLNWEFSSEDNSKGRIYLLRELHKFLEGHINFLSNIEYIAQERLKILTKRELRRDRVRKRVHEENHKHSFHHLLHEAAKTPFSPLALNSFAFKEYIRVLAAGSHSPLANKEEQEKIILNYMDAQSFLQEAALNKEPLTPEFISNLNLILTQKTFNNNGTPGKYRIDGQEAQAYRYYFIAGADVIEEITILCHWISEQLKRCAGSLIEIIEIAARVYSWSISIHPFKDGNRRTCRMLANYILHSYQLPGALMAEDKSYATVFGDLHANEVSAKPSTVLKNFAEGMLIANSIIY